MLYESSEKESTINDVILHSTQSPQRDSGSPQLVQADNDTMLIQLWMHGKSKHTQRYYFSDIQRFQGFINKPFNRVILSDLQKFADSLNENLSDGSKRRMLSSIKSLFAFSHKLGYLPFDISKPLILPTPKDNLAERIMTEDEIHRLINTENHPRNKMILKFLFITGVRVSELCSGKWSDLKIRTDGGQVTVYGKGSKTRAIIIPEPLWSDLIAFKNTATDDMSIFRGRKNSNKLHPTTILRLVKRAAKKAGLSEKISPHWLRHGHASIAAEKAPLHVIQQSLGHSSIQTTSRYLHVKPNDCSSKYLKL
ncbi:MAG: tyrosine-type recombinase/integrase [Sedimentisphaerales bacterium]